MLFSRKKQKILNFGQENSGADRKVYECFINADVAPDAPDPSTRLFSHMDLFPTMLSAMGFQIEGDRLGLGVNLFSQQSTLVEQCRSAHSTMEARGTEYLPFSHRLHR